MAPRRDQRPQVATQLKTITARRSEPLQPSAVSWQRPLSDLGIDGVIALFGLVISRDPLFTAYSGRSWDEYDAMTYWTLLSGLLGYRLWRAARFGWFRWSVRQIWPIYAVLGMGLASSFWSLDPEDSRHWALWIAETTFLGFFIGYRFHGPRLMLFLFWYFVVLLIGSLSIMFVDQKLSVPFLYKNERGFLLAFALSYFIVGLVFDRMGRLIGLGLLVLSVLLLANAKSASAIVIAGLSLSMLSVLSIGKRFRMTALAAIVLVVSAPFVMYTAIANLNPATAVLARDPTLTGRTEIWADAIKIVQARPLIGFGVEAVWGDNDATRFPNLKTTSQHYHAHNGYLNVANEMGVVVVMVATLCLLRILFIALEMYIQLTSPSALVAVIFLTSFLVYNIVEVGLFQHARLEWILCVAIVVAVTRRVCPVE